MSGISNRNLGTTNPISPVVPQASGPHTANPANAATAPLQSSGGIRNDSNRGAAHAGIRAYQGQGRVSSLATLALNRFLKEADGGKEGPIIRETAEELCQKVGVEADDELLDVLNRSLDRQSISNLAKVSNMGSRQLNINDAIRVGTGEKPRRAILAAAEILSKEAQGFTFREAVSGNVSPENAALALTKASQAQLSINDIGEVFGRAISHPSEEVQLHTLNLLGSAIPVEGFGIGVRQRILIKGAQSSHAAVRAKVAELLPALYPSEMGKQMILSELDRWQST